MSALKAEHKLRATNSQPMLTTKTDTSSSPTSSAIATTRT
ncbi:hypothetical protein EVA_17166 [gut metagenome]|uniref:Uncharacterized protein n=1 Tax=gut metagenome TaxID=749906 RepID=J9FYV3_9ZZZZ